VARLKAIPHDGTARCDPAKRTGVSSEILAAIAVKNHLSGNEVASNLCASSSFLDGRLSDAVEDSDEGHVEDSRDTRYERDGVGMC